ncbi:MAG: CDP-glycerol glycerophosphotransferase family protein [Eubacteriales bacterium]|nr:CDP-glycerol glycerophosphotransferase family protein [Eubacteriales bacterium]
MNLNVPACFLYIDPGTGSMLFTILLAVIGASFYSMRLLFFKLRFRMGSCKAERQEAVLDLVIFSDDKRYWSIFEPICAELDRRGKSFTYLTASEDDPALKKKYEHMEAEFIGQGNKAYAKLNMLEAKLLLATTPGLEVYQWKRSPGVRCYVHIPHAASEVTLYRMFALDYYDAVMLSGSFQLQDIRALEKLRNLAAKDLRLTGIPYMDEMKKRLQEASPLAAQSRTILLAPSWGKNSIFSLYGARIIERLLNTGWQIIVRPHPHSFQVEKELIDDLMSKYPASSQLEWNRDTDNFEVLRRADLLISDFSGVIFEFALVYDKPVLYTEPDFDLSVYDAWWLDTPLWTYSALPRLGIALTESKLDQLEELVEDLLAHPRFAAGRDEVRQECWAYPDEGASRSVDYLLEKLAEVKAAELVEEKAGQES